MTGAWLLFPCYGKMVGFEPTGLGSNPNLNSHCEILDELSGLSELVPLSHKEDK